MDADIRKKYSDSGDPRGKLLATNWLEGISDSSDHDTVEVTFKNTRNGFFVNSSGLPLKIGDIVAVEASPGHDIGRVSMVGRLVSLQMKKAGIKPETELKRVFRLATQQDLEKYNAARAKEHDTMIRTRKIAEELDLNMKIGDVEYQGDGGKAIFYYIADERVDFRKLIRILADTFKVRVEMKQIGARQEAGRIGGIGPCGRPLCCASWMTHFVSVGTGAARIQDLSMNPQKLAGQCGKLKCCLNFETDVYVEAQKKMPPKDAVLETADASYYFFKPDPLAGTVTYSTDRKIPANLVTISVARAHEIIEMNRRGEKAEALQTKSEGAATASTTYVDLVEQESLTRFDKSKKKKKKKAPQKPGKKGPEPGRKAPEPGRKGPEQKKQPDSKTDTKTDIKPDRGPRPDKPKKPRRKPQGPKQGPSQQPPQQNNNKNPE